MSSTGLSGAQSFPLPDRASGEPVTISVVLTDNNTSTGHLNVWFLDENDIVITRLIAWTGVNNSQLSVENESFNISSPNIDTFGRNTLSITLEKNVFTHIEANSSTIPRDVLGEPELANATHITVGFESGYGSGVAVEVVAAGPLPVAFWWGLLIAFVTMVVLAILGAIASKRKAKKKAASVSP